MEIEPRCEKNFATLKKNKKKTIKVGVLGGRGE
jgi:hypothetical protein